MTDRQLDARIARELFGLTVEDRRLWQRPDTGAWGLCPWCNADPPGHCPSLDLAVPPERHPVGPAQRTPAGWRVVPFYSARIEDAWAVVEYMSHRDWGYELGTWSWTEVYAVFYKGPDESLTRGSAEAKTMPLSICMAALAALETVGPK